MSSYRAIPAQVDLPAIERSILDFWRTHSIFERSLDARVGSEAWTFFEGPPTANGAPGTHHIEARVFKDVFPRYHTMKGKYVSRKAGWDCHGLPVEIAVEKELGFAGKGDIEKFGIAQFNEKCKESVQRHVGAFTTMTDRMGFWVDFDKAYWTMSPEYVESVWWSLQQIWNKGLLVQDHRVAPYCPRCGTGLSDHELAQGYETVTDPSVYVRFPITSGPLATLGASFLVWTTTPWTLVSNTAIALNPTVTYVVVEETTEEGSEVLVLAEPLLAILKGEVKVLKKMQGSEFERMTYKPVFNLVDIPDAHFAVLADYVTTEDGTGLVHQSPAFGADDLQVSRAYGLPVVNPVLADGTFGPEVDLIGGMFFKDADKVLVKQLRANGVLYKHLPYEHQYPHCWRCHTPLMYYAQPSWYIRTTAIKSKLIRENQKTNWHPETIKTGRYGDWLKNNIDWALSRNRYWGTPLPIWRCENKHDICVGSLKELGKLAGAELSALDPHRPFVDDISWPCEQCGAAMIRVNEVIDCWYDSGAMPFAQWGYPHQEGSVEKFKAAYPADFICEAIDQTRGWFYTLMTIGTLVFDESSYKNVLCLGHILDKDGRKMSKHLGNTLEPIALMDEHGADAVRWFMLAAGSPWAARRVGHEVINDVVRKTLLTYWNTVSFLALYAKAADFDISTALPLSERPLMDRWIISDLNVLINEVDTSFNDFDTQRAGKALATFIDDLSNWYVRRSRRRFWDGDPSALATLHEALRTLTLLLAPMVPFITEHVWQELIAPVEENAPHSVHLADFPIAKKSAIDATLSANVALTRRIVELGRAARAESGVKIRQPLQRALIAAAGWSDLPLEMKDQIAEELNVVELEDIAGAHGDLVDVSIKANFKSLGTKYGAKVQEIAKAIVHSPAAELVHTLRTKKSTTITFESQSWEIDINDVIVTEVPKTGWTVASHEAESVAIDLELSPALIAKGHVREAIRFLQEKRKSDGFDISDRITVAWNAHAEVVAAILSGTPDISAEVLATSMARDEKIHLGDNELGLNAHISKN
ncbi:MAG: isoleucine--tRNA ligase [Actinomycetes bacterium]